MPKQVLLVADNVINNLQLLTGLCQLFGKSAGRMKNLVLGWHYFVACSTTLTQLPIVSSPDQIFHVCPAALLKNRVWTLDTFTGKIPNLSQFS